MHSEPEKYLFLYRCNPTAVWADNKLQLFLQNHASFVKNGIWAELSSDMKTKALTYLGKTPTPENFC